MNALKDEKLESGEALKARDAGDVDDVQDARLSYEAPRIVKRRTMAHATLFTDPGPGQGGGP